MAEPAPHFFQLLKQERFYVLFGLFSLVALSWGYLLAWQMPTGGEVWSFSNYLTMFTMWAVMMIAMMVPSALPMILIYSHSVKKSRRDGGNLAPVGVFVLGYVTMWTLFSVWAAFLQLFFQLTGIITTMMKSSEPEIMGGFLILTGFYQVSPLKDTCLRFCQHPVMFITKHWKTGTFGAFRMGVIHGGYCVGCCWALMILLFVGGVMNLLWVAALAIFVLLEKVIPTQKKWRLYSGLGMIVGGFILVFTGVG